MEQLKNLSKIIVIVCIPIIVISSFVAISYNGWFWDIPLYTFLVALFFLFVWMFSSLSVSSRKDKEYFASQEWADEKKKAGKALKKVVKEMSSKEGQKKIKKLDKQFKKFGR